MTDVLTFVQALADPFTVLLTCAFVVGIIEWGVNLVTGRDRARSG